MDVVRLCNYCETMKFILNGLLKEILYWNNVAFEYQVFVRMDNILLQCENDR